MINMMVILKVVMIDMMIIVMIKMDGDAYSHGGGRV